MKKCFKCKQFKSLDNFYKCKRDGYQSSCKLCKRELKKISNKKYYLNNKNKLSIYNKQKYLSNNPEYAERVILLNANKIKCLKCKEIKNFEYFRDEKRNTRMRYKSKTCFNCEKVKSRVYNKELRKDGLFRLIKSLRTELGSFIKKGIKKGATRYLNYSLEDLKSHLESRFKPGMSWNNYGRGGWHLDHIVPLKYKNLDGSYYWNQEELCDPSSETFHKVWGLNNLQPLWAKENIKKGSRRIL